MIRVNSAGMGLDHLVETMAAPFSFCGLRSFPDHWVQDHARGLPLCLDCRDKMLKPEAK